MTDYPPLRRRPSLHLTEAADSNHLQDQLKTLQRENAQLRARERASLVDYATGARGGQYFYDRVAQELARGRRFGHPVSIALVEVGEHRRIEDLGGPSAFSQVLRWVARLVMRATREYDVLCRLGAAELALVLPGASLGGAHLLCDRLDRMASTARDKPRLPGPDSKYGL
ncbi:MAG: GGDEF domain-containing protein, partial [Myxococcota bacterium]